MSCDGNRLKYFKHAANHPLCEPDDPFFALLGGRNNVAVNLEKIYQTYKNAPRRSPRRDSIVQAKTLSLFAKMRQAGIKPPVHSKTGLPKLSSCYGYAAVKDTLSSAQLGVQVPGMNLVTPSLPVPDAKTQAAAEKLADFLRDIEAKFDAGKPLFDTNNPAISLKAWSNYDRAFTRRNVPNVLQFFGAKQRQPRTWQLPQGTTITYHAHSKKWGHEFHISGDSNSCHQVLVSANYAQALAHTMAAAHVLEIVPANRLAWLNAVRNVFGQGDAEGYLVRRDAAEIWHWNYIQRLHSKGMYHGQEGGLHEAFYRCDKGDA